MVAWRIYGRLARNGHFGILSCSSHFTQRGSRLSPLPAPGGRVQGGPGWGCRGTMWLRLGRYFTLTSSLFFWWMVRLFLLPFASHEGSFGFIEEISRSKFLHIVVICCQCDLPMLRLEMPPMKSRGYRCAARWGLGPRGRKPLHPTHFVRALPCCKGRVTSTWKARIPPSPRVYTKLIFF